MNNSEGTDREEEPRQEKTSSGLGKDFAPVEPATQEQLQRAEDTIEKRMSAFERATIRLTTIGVFVGILTFIIFVGQLYEMYEAGTQTDKLIGAADALARTASQQAQAAKSTATAAADQAKFARSFADSAIKMNFGIANAVGKLNLQATAANRLSKDTESANNNILEADRPWMGASISVANFDVGKKTTFTTYFTNSGKRPARVDLTAMRENLYPRFPADPDREYIFDTTPSTNIVVPGQPVISIQSLTDPLTQMQMSLLTSGQLTYFIFGKIEYRDIRTNESYWTHVCLRYMPKMKTDTDNGFRNCAKYNDAK